MHPDLLKLGPITIKSWGVMLAISVLIATFISLKRAKRFGVKPDTVYDMVFLVVISSILGSRLWYVVFHLDEFRGHWFDTINPFHGPGGFGIAGLSMMGGIVLAVVTIALYSIIKKLRFVRIADVIAPTFLLGAGITRIGCFLNGCCYGRPTNGVLSVVFPDGAAGYFWKNFVAQHPDTVMTGLIPTQLIASLLGFTLFFLVLWLERWRFFDGYTSWLVLFLYSVDRFAVDQFRSYEAEQILGYVGPFMITVNEIILFLLIVYSVTMFIFGASRARKKSG